MNDWSVAICPPLATAAVAIPLLYVVLCMGSAQTDLFIFEWLGFLLLAMVILHGLVTHKDRLLTLLGVSANIALPFCLFSPAPFYARNGSAHMGRR